MAKKTDKKLKVILLSEKAEQHFYVMSKRITSEEEDIPSKSEIISQCLEELSDFEEFFQETVTEYLYNYGFYDTPKPDMPYKIYDEAQVKELLQKQREACVEAWLGSVEVGAQKVANIIRNAVLTI